jgi:alpha-1,2-glucosyltransferase
MMQWDPKITTLPGLYLLSVGVLRPLSSILTIDVCGTYALRMTNVFACFANFYIIYNLQKRLFPERTVSVHQNHSSAFYLLVI